MGNCDTGGADRVGDVAFRSDRGIRGVGNMRFFDEKGLAPFRNSRRTAPSAFHYPSSPPRRGPIPTPGATERRARALTEPGNALLISIASAGVQLSQPQAPVNGYYSSQQIAAASLGQQFGELGQEYARRLSIPNTLEIRPGYRFMVMINKDMHLRPYVDHRSATGTIPVSLGPVVQ